MSALCYPFSDMGATIECVDEFIITRNEGVQVWDDEGRRYLDVTSCL